MKKVMVLVLSLIMLLSVVGVASAEVVEIKGEGSGSFDLSSYSEGTLIITILYGEEAVTKGVNEQWGVGYLCQNVDGWPNVQGFEIKAGGTAVAGETFQVKFDVAAVKAAGASVVNVYNGCSVVKVEVETGSTASADPTPTPAGGTSEPTPVTGDAMNIVVLAGLAAVALGGVIVAKKARA